jgi:hypothetical protein
VPPPEGTARFGIAAAGAGVRLERYPEMERYLKYVSKYTDSAVTVLYSSI